MRFPDGRVNVRGKVVAWSPPRRLATTWTVEWMPELRELPECLVSYDIEPAGDCVKLTLTELILMGCAGCPASGRTCGLAGDFSSLKSVLETGKPLAIKIEPPKEMMEAVKQVLMKPWLKRF